MKKKNIINITIGSLLMVGAGIQTFKLLKKYQNKKELSLIIRKIEGKNNDSLDGPNYIKLPYQKKII